MKSAGWWVFCENNQGWVGAALSNKQKTAFGWVG